MTRREFDLSDDDGAFIQSRVEAGAGDADTVLGSAIKLLREEVARIDRWMREEVIPSYEQWLADGKPTVSEEEVWASVDAAITEAARRKAS